MPQPSTFHLEQFLVHAYHVGEIEAGRRAAAILDGRTMVPPIEERFRGNRTWYSRWLGDYLPLKQERLHVPAAYDGWSVTNPCVASDGGDTLLVNLRSINYTIASDGSYEILNADGIVRTANSVLRVDPETLLPVGPAWVWPDPSPRGGGRSVHGLEDVRLTWSGESKQWTASGTVCGAPSPQEPWGMREIGVCRLRFGVEQPVSDFFLPPPVVPGRHEKNWMPIEGLARRWVYACWEDGETSVVRASIADGAPVWSVRKTGPAPAAAKYFRGGSQLVRVGADDAEWVACVHEVLPGDGAKRVYEHRFVTFGRDLRITGYSAPWWFAAARQIEFCCGMALSGDRLVISYGVRDAEAWLASAPVECVLSMCDPPTE